jgi:SPX domain protein involved in polyphosphate accumulation
MNKNISENDKGRYEIKFILNEADLVKAHNWLNSHTSAKKSYPVRTVHSLYFDNCDFQSVKDNLTGLSNRYKVRLRWYDNEESSPVTPTLEIKQRRDRLGFKDHILIPELTNKIQELSSSEITNIMINSAIKTPSGCNILNQPLNPTLHVTYDRHYYVDHNDIRITEDENIRFSYIVPTLKLSELSSLPYSFKIMELKFLPDMKSEISSLFKNLHLAPKRHSKYLTGLSLFRAVQYI